MLLLKMQFLFVGKVHRKNENPLISTIPGGAPVYPRFSQSTYLFKQYQNSLKEKMGSSPESIEVSLKRGSDKNEKKIEFLIESK